MVLSLYFIEIDDSTGHGRVVVMVLSGVSLNDGKIPFEKQSTSQFVTT